MSNDTAILVIGSVWLLLAAVALVILEHDKTLHALVRYWALLTIANVWLAVGMLR